MTGHARAMTKNELRIESKSAREAFVSKLTVANRLIAEGDMARRVVAATGEARVVSVYLPIGSEADTQLLIEQLATRGLALALPHVRGPREPMRFLGWLPGEPLVRGPMGLQQPEETAPEVEPDVIVTPLLAFDDRLHRLGYGAGHYDRIFARYPRAYRVGLAWHDQRVAELPTEPWDVPLHAVATEREWIIV